MSGWDIFDLAFCLFVGVALGLDAYLNGRREKGWIASEKQPIYGSTISSWILLCVLIVLPLRLVTGILAGSAYQQLLRIGIGLLAISVFYSLLLVTRPLLRNWLRASSFAILWSAPCVVLYFFTHGWSGETGALWDIRIPFSHPDEVVLLVAAAIWVVVFAVILLWSVVSHLLFRRWLLKDAVLMAENDVKHACAKQMKIVHYPDGDILVYTTDKIQTPLTVGLFLRTMCIVLPDRAYTPEELALIFRHELVHICRGDSRQKLFMTFCSALMWFNPLMWLAMRRCAEDLEFSCDEAVLYGYEPEVRRQYAGLLLQTAADQRGITTCLAASPGSLRYRLKEAVNPQRRFTGGVLVGILCTLLMIVAIFMGVSFRPKAEQLFRKSDRQAWVISDVFVTDGEKDPDSEIFDEDALYDYVASLELSLYTKELNPMGESRHIQIQFHSQDQFLVVQIGGKQVKVLKEAFLGNDRYRREEVYYIMEEELDMEYILSCLHG